MFVGILNVGIPIGTKGFNSFDLAMTHPSLLDKYVGRMTLRRD